MYRRIYCYKYIFMKAEVEYNIYHIDTINAELILFQDIALKIVWLFQPQMTRTQYSLSHRFYDDNKNCI